MRITLAAYSCRDSRRVGVKPRTAFPFKPSRAPARSCSRTIVPVRQKRYCVPLELPSDVVDITEASQTWAAKAIGTRLHTPFGPNLPAHQKSAIILYSLYYFR